MLHLDRCWPGWSGRVPCVVRWSRCAEAGALEQSRASRKLVVSGYNECLLYTTLYTTKPRTVAVSGLAQSVWLFGPNRRVERGAA